MSEYKTPTQRCVQYAMDVREGKIVACVAIKNAVERFFNDLEKADDDWLYEYNPKCGDHAAEFIEMMPHTKGKWAGRKETIQLQPWQCFVICNIFGWVFKGTTRRRFRKAYIQVGRKNGKSIISAGVGLYMLTADGEPGAEVYCGATSKKQAFEVFTPARLMVEKTPEFASHYGVKALKSKIICDHDNSFFEPEIGKPKDGASPHCGIVDEYHEHQSNEVVDTFITGMGSRAMEGSPLLLIITTAGTNIDGPCYDEYMLCKKVLDGSDEDDRLFAAIYEIDQAYREDEVSDDWTDPDNFIKANPNMGVSVGFEFLNDQLGDATRDAKKQNPFMIKHLNKWVGAGESWLSFADWRACGENVMPEKYLGWNCAHCIDLASKCDIAAYIKVFFDYSDGVLRFAVFPKFYLPKEMIQREKTGKYEKWVKGGHIIATPGEEIDFEIIKNDIEADCSQFGAHEIPYDPWNATFLAQQLSDKDLPVLEFQQSVKNMSGAMYEMEGAVKSRRLSHNNNPVMNWMVSNVIVQPDRNDNIFPRKQRNSSKIDGAVGAIMGVARGMAYRDDNLDFSEGLFVV